MAALRGRDCCRQCRRRGGRAGCSRGRPSASIPGEPHVSRRSAAELVAAGFTLTALVYGLARFAYGLLLPQIRAELSLSSVAAGWIGSAAFAAYCIGIFAAFLMVPRCGARIVAALTRLCATAGLALAGLCRLGAAAWRRHRPGRCQHGPRLAAAGRRGEPACHRRGPAARERRHQRGHRGRDHPLQPCRSGFRRRLARALLRFRGYRCGNHSLAVAGHSGRDRRRQSPDGPSAAPVRAGSALSRRAGDGRRQYGHLDLRGRHPAGRAEIFRRRHRAGLDRPGRRRTGRARNGCRDGPSRDGTGSPPVAVAVAVADGDRDDLPRRGGRGCSPALSRGPGRPRPRAAVPDDCGRAYGGSAGVRHAA
ncbi:MFS transporter [Cereibacter sphaeroides]|nr:MFS transporter [Cereibacter sphaeroides]